MKKTFRYEDVMQLDAKSWWFECAMISTCAPVFDWLSDNYDVEEELRAAGVIDATCEPDTESCALVVNFGVPEHGHAFIDRLNEYLDARAPKRARAVTP